MAGPGEMEPCRGGTVQIDFADSGTAIDSKVRGFDPPSMLKRAFDLERQGSRVLEVALAGPQRPRPGGAA